MSILDTFYTGEKLREKWGEVLPVPAQIRVNIIDLAVQHARGSKPVQESNMERSQASAAKIVDNVIGAAESETKKAAKLDVSNVPSSKEKEGDNFIDMQFVNEGPVRNPETVKQAVLDSGAGAMAQEAQERISAIHEATQNAE